MQLSRNIAIIVLLLELVSLKSKVFVNGAMTMAQMKSTMDTMRTICGQKHKLTDELIDGLKKGMFIEENKDLKCYTHCVLQMAGTLSKKNEISGPKTLSQIENLLPEELKEFSLKAFEACKDVQKGYKEACDRTFYSTKCLYEYNPEKFLFP